MTNETLTLKAEKTKPMDISEGTRLSIAVLERQP